MSYLEKLKLKNARSCIQALFFLFMFSSCYRYDNQTKGYLTQRFKVQAFPTYILLNPDGKIIKRGSGKEYLSKVKSYLISKLK